MKRSLKGIITMSNRALVTLFAIPLLVLAGCSREKSDWHSAQAADSPESYEQFITTHPDSTLVATARERLQQLAPGTAGYHAWADPVSTSTEMTARDLRRWPSSARAQTGCRRHPRRPSP